MNDRILTLVALFLAHFLAGQAYLESDGLVVIEAENVDDPGSLWAIETSVPGFKGTGYLRCLRDNFSTGGNGILSYPIKISNAGAYQFCYRSRIGSGTSNTDFNDTFVRLVDAGGLPVALRPNSNVVTSGSWYKVYMNTVGVWSHQSSNKDNDPHSLSWDLEAGKEYAIQISTRSKDHLVDRLILWDRGRYNYANEVTGKQPVDSALDRLPASTVGSTWAGFPVDSDNWTDTGDFLGWLFVGSAPWLYNLTLDGWMYVREEAVTDSGAWTYVVRP